jgi:hypothetical protein
MTYDRNTDRTCLRSSEAGVDGHAFQATLVGFDYTREPTNADLVVAETAEVVLIGHAAVDHVS